MGQGPSTQLPALLHVTVPEAYPQDRGTVSPPKKSNCAAARLRWVSSLLQVLGKEDCLPLGGLRVESQDLIQPAGDRVALPPPHVRHHDAPGKCCPDLQEVSYACAGGEAHLGNDGAGKST